MANISMKIVLRRPDKPDEVRRVFMQQCDWSALWARIYKLWPSLSGNDMDSGSEVSSDPEASEAVRRLCRLQYTDDENDTITVSSQPEWEECLRQFAAGPLSRAEALKLWLSPRPRRTATNAPASAAAAVSDRKAERANDKAIRRMEKERRREQRAEARAQKRQERRQERSERKAAKREARLGDHVAEVVAEVKISKYVVEIQASGEVLGELVVRSDNRVIFNDAFVDATWTPEGLAFDMFSLRFTSPAGGEGYLLNAEIVPLRLTKIGEEVVQETKACGDNAASVVSALEQLVDMIHVGTGLAEKVAKGKAVDVATVVNTAKDLAMKLFAKFDKEAVKEHVQEAAKLLQLSATVVCDHDATALYNLACAHSILGTKEDLEKSADALHRALANGYTNVRHAWQDKDLTNLRNSAWWPFAREELWEPRNSAAAAAATAAVPADIPAEEKPLVAVVGEKTSSCAVTTAAEPEPQPEPKKATAPVPQYDKELSLLMCMFPAVEPTSLYQFLQENEGDVSRVATLLL